VSRRAAEFAEVALGYISAEKAEVPSALYAEASGLGSNAPASATSAAKLGTSQSLRLSRIRLVISANSAALRATKSLIGHQLLFLQFNILAV